MDFLLQLPAAPLSWTLDQKIQALILTVLLLTLGWGMLVEIPKLRKRIKFLRFTLRRVPTGNPPFTRVEVDFSNNCRRVIHSRKLYSTTHSGHISGETLDWVELKEGEDRHVIIDFDQALIEDNDLNGIFLIDSVDKLYKGYVYKGRFRNYWMIRILLLRDRIVFPFS